MINVLLVLNLSFGFAKVSRISEEEVDLSKTKLIYMTPGRSTLIDMPCEISHSLLGLNQDIKIVIGPDDKNTFTLWVMSAQSQPTNLTVRCGGEVFVFDIFPNRHNHQDYIKVMDYYSEEFRGEFTADKNQKKVTPELEGKILEKEVVKSGKQKDEEKELVLSGEI